MSEDSDKRHVIIGDVHGCLNEFKALLELVKYNPDVDVGVSLGDLVDRGPRPAECIALAKSLKFVLVKSNHDLNAIRWKRTFEKVKYQSIQTGKAIECHPEADKLWKYLECAVPFYHFMVAGVKYACAHAGVIPEQRFDTPVEWATKIRYISASGEPTKRQGDGCVFWADKWHGPEKIIYGHSVFAEPRIAETSIGIDTGCCFGNKLTAMIIKSDGQVEYHSVKSNFNYKQVSNANQANLDAAKVKSE